MFGYKFSGAFPDMFPDMFPDVFPDTFPDTFSDTWGKHFYLERRIELSPRITGRPTS